MGLFLQRLDSLKKTAVSFHRSFLHLSFTLPIDGRFYKCNLFERISIYIKLLAILIPTYIKTKRSQPFRVGFHFSYFVIRNSSILSLLVQLPVSVSDVEQDIHSSCVPPFHLRRPSHSYESCDLFCLPCSRITLPVDGKITFTWNIIHWYT